MSWEQNEEASEGERVSVEARGAPIRPRLQKRLGVLRRRLGIGGASVECSASVLKKRPNIVD